jgi:hypothetical protein
MHNTKKDINELYQRLRQYRGSMGEIASRTGRSREWVRRVLTSEWIDLELIRVATAVLRERYDEEVAIRASMESTVTECDTSALRPAHI